MPLRPPSPEDQRKLHAEVNQINNQRFLLTTLALTISGVALNWILPKQTPPAAIGAFEFSVATLLSLTVVALFLFSQFLRGNLRIYTTYLAETSTSAWEADFADFRRSGHLWFGFSELPLFMCIIALSTLAPFLLSYIFWVPIQAHCVVKAVDLAVGVAGITTVYLMGFKGYGRPDEKIAKLWKKLNEPPSPK
jgi:hypothetical protein